MSSKKDDLDIWRLSDELNMIDAAVLIIGENPSEKIENSDGGSFQQRTNYDNFDAAFKSLRNAIFKNKLRATITYNTRQEATMSVPYYADRETFYHSKIIDQDDEITINYDQIIRSNNYASSIVCSDPELVFGSGEKIWLLREPNWVETTIDVDELKGWLRSRNFYPNFFFPEGGEDNISNKNNDRYSPKLACAVSAWEHVVSPMPNKSVKESIASWVQANGVNFGLADETGTVANKAVEQIATVVNWNTRGGANPSGAQVNATQIRPVENFPDFVSNLDDKIPF